MINVIVSVRVKEGLLLDFVKLFKSDIPNVLAEKGCIEYTPMIDIPTGLPPQELNRSYFFCGPSSYISPIFVAIYMKRSLEKNNFLWLLNTDVLKGLIKAI